MSIRRAPRPNSNFYILDKSISEDKTLTWAARGMLVFLLGKPDNWTVSIQALINETEATRKQSGRDAIYALIAELKEAGYLKVEQGRESGGAFGSVDYTVSESPLPVLPDTGKPLPANPRLTRTDKKQVLNKTKGADDPEKQDADPFEIFWSAYPKKSAKQDAIKAWGQVQPVDLPALMAALAIQKTTAQWTKDKGQYIPLPASWLRGLRWQDEVLVDAPDGGWWTTRAGVEAKGKALGIDAPGSPDALSWLRFSAAVWVEVGDGPHWDHKSAVYPIAVGLRDKPDPKVSALLAGIDLSRQKHDLKPTERTI